MAAAIYLMAVLVSASTAPLAAAEPDLLALLPARVGAWSASGDDAVYSGRSIFEYMDGAGEIYLAYRFRRLAVRQYTRPSHPSIVAELYDMSDPEDAYGVFTYDTDGTPLTLGQGALYSAGLLRFWKGRYFVRLMVQQETTESKSALLDLGRGIARAIPEAGRPPDLLRCLPQQGLIRSEVRYLRSNTVLSAHYFIADANILALGQDTEAVLCRWQTPSGKLRALICRYPDAERAAQAYTAFVRTYLRLSTISDRSFAVVERGTVAGAGRIGRILIMVFEARDRRQCETMLGAISKRVKEVFHEQMR